MTDPTASFHSGLFSCDSIHCVLTVTSVPLVAATPWPGLMVIVNFLGAVNPSLARHCTKMGYHLSISDRSLVSAHSLSCGDSDTSSVYSKSFTTAFFGGPAGTSGSA